MGRIRQRTGAAVRHGEIEGRKAQGLTQGLEQGPFTACGCGIEKRGPRDRRKVDLSRTHSQGCCLFLLVEGHVQAEKGHPEVTEGRLPAVAAPILYLDSSTWRAAQSGPMNAYCQDHVIA